MLELALLIEYCIATPRPTRWRVCKSILSLISEVIILLASGKLSVGTGNAARAPQEYSPPPPFSGTHVNKYFFHFLI